MVLHQRHNFTATFSTFNMFWGPFKSVLNLKVLVDDVNQEKALVKASL